MATYKLVIQDEPNVEFEIEEFQAEEIIVRGVEGFIHLPDDVLGHVLHDDYEYVIVKRLDAPKHAQECWSVHKDSFEAIHGMTLEAYVHGHTKTTMPDVKPPQLEQVNDVFKQLVSWNERLHSSERQVIGADATETIGRVKQLLTQLIFDMYEHEHAVMPEVPQPPQQDGEHDINGNYVGDLVLNYNLSKSVHNLTDYLNNGWTREQLLKEKLFIVKPAQQPPCTPPSPAAPAMFVEQTEPKELAISHLLLDLKDNNLPDSVRNLVELLVNLETESK